MFKIDLPEAATADDYERVPIVCQLWGLLCYAVWAGPTELSPPLKSAKRRKNGLAELYLPQARPALLGIGAKERLEPDDERKEEAQGSRYVLHPCREKGADHEWEERECVERDKF